MPKTTILFRKDGILSSAERKRVRELTYSDGQMWRKFCDEEIQKDAMLIKYGNIIVGWSTVLHYSTYKNFHIYISKYFRRMGFGTKLFKYAKKRFGKLNTFSWDTRSAAFYKTLE